MVRYRDYLASHLEILFTDQQIEGGLDCGPAAGVASEEELQQGSESEGAVAEGSLARMEQELDSATAQLAAVRERVGHLRADEDRRAAGAS